MANKDLENLREKLNQMNQWPTEYLFKFIVADQPEKIKAVLQYFDEDTDLITYKASSKGTYQSISIRKSVHSADQVVEIYSSVSTIEGVMAL